VNLPVKIAGDALDGAQLDLTGHQLPQSKETRPCLLYRENGDEQSRKPEPDELDDNPTRKYYR
jgi:hypothetical protein